MGSVIAAIGSANPPNCFKQEQILRFMIAAHELNENNASRLKTLYELSGIETRHSVLPDFGNANGSFSFFGNGSAAEPFPSTRQRMKIYRQNAKAVSAEAANNLFKKHPDLDTAAITHLITVSCTGMYAPGLDIDLIEMLALNKNIERTCINFMGCYGAFNALKVADYICEADVNAKVLIVAVELCTIHFQKENTLDNWLANSLFSDGAAVVLVENSKNGSSAPGFKMKAFFNELVTEAKDEMAWYIGNTGFDMRLSSHIAKNIKKRVSAVTEKLTAKAKLTLKDVDRLAIHPGGRRILEVCNEVLEFPAETMKYSFDVLRQYGNMSSVTVLFVLEQLFGDVNRGEQIMSFAFGPGLTFESMILETV